MVSQVMAWIQSALLNALLAARALLTLRLARLALVLLLNAPPKRWLDGWHNHCSARSKMYTHSHGCVTFRDCTSQPP